MAKLIEKTEQITDTNQLHDRLKELSLKEGGAWSFSITPFSHEVVFVRAGVPSGIPDQYLEFTRGCGEYPRGRIGHKGKIIGFSEAVWIREQNRGVGGDR